MGVSVLDHHRKEAGCPSSCMYAGQYGSQIHYSFNINLFLPKSSNVQLWRLELTLTAATEAQSDYNGIQLSTAVL